MYFEAYVKLGKSYKYHSQPKLITTNILITILFIIALNSAMMNMNLNTFGYIYAVLIKVYQKKGFGCVKTLGRWTMDTRYTVEPVSLLWL